MSGQRTASQQVCSPTLELTGTAAGENETEVLIPFNQQMDLVKQERQFLAFINDDELGYNLWRMSSGATLSSRKGPNSSRS